jgi:exodeoxyribonuclease V alpha subunit
MPISLTGRIERITYTNSENGFTIATVKVPDRHQPVTVLGKLIAPVPGVTIRMEGDWTRHSKYGRQFKIVSYETTVPVTLEGIERYLGSGMIPGLGPVMARRIVRKFGKDTLKIIDEDIHRLAEVDGIGTKRVAMIIKAWEAQKDILAVMIFLQSHGVSSTYATKIFSFYGNRSIAAVKENPFRLATDIPGIGFLTADRIAAKLDILPDSEIRVKAGILYVLRQVADEGNVFYPYEMLITKSIEILSVSREAVKNAVGALFHDRDIVIEDLNRDSDNIQQNYKAVYLTHLHVCETEIARRLKSLLAAPKIPRKIQVDEALAWVQRQLSIVLARNQIKAVRFSLEKKLLVITGGPGTGKTTIINAVLRIFSRLGVRILLAAPTGRAAKRMSETCGKSARTIHRLLEFSPAKGGFQKNDRHPLNCDLLVVDEASMIDTVLMHHLLKAIPAGAILILVGDVNQLPSVGAGSVLKDIIDSEAVAVVELNEIFRQARQSRIVVNAHKINRGKMPELNPSVPSDPSVSDFYFIQQEDPEKVVEIILKLVTHRIPQRFDFDPMDDIQVLSPMHRGVVGTTNLNQQLQNALNPGEDRFTRNGLSFRINDKVMQIINNYDKEVFNGDIGRIARIESFTQHVTVIFDGREVVYEPTELDQMVPAYAISVHKSQGSEYPAVIIPVLTQHFLLLQRNLIYTAITRGRHLVVIIGTRKALGIAINNDKVRKRYTDLKHRLTWSA